MFTHVTVRILYCARDNLGLPQLVKSINNPTETRSITKEACLCLDRVWRDRDYMLKNWPVSCYSICVIPWYFTALLVLMKQYAFECTFARFTIGILPDGLACLSATGGKVYSKWMTILISSLFVQMLQIAVCVE